MGNKFEQIHEKLEYIKNYFDRLLKMFNVLFYSGKLQFEIIKNIFHKTKNHVKFGRHNTQRDLRLSKHGSLKLTRVLQPPVTSRAAG
jgi:hypothetical protein